jgi:hypothetical protein
MKSIPFSMPRSNLEQRPTDKEIDKSLRKIMDYELQWNSVVKCAGRVVDRGIQHTTVVVA